MEYALKLLLLAVIVFAAGGLATFAIRFSEKIIEFGWLKRRKKRPDRYIKINPSLFNQMIEHLELAQKYHFVDATQTIINEAKVTLNEFLNKQRQ